MSVEYPGDDVAHAAFDVMMRRKWRVCPVAVPDAWAVLNEKNVVLWHNNECFTAPDPFTALVEADRWMKEQETKNG